MGYMAAAVALKRLRQEDLVLDQQVLTYLRKNTSRTKHIEMQRLV